MTKAEFTNNLRAAVHSEAMPKDYLSDIYDSIEATPIVMHDKECGEPEEKSHEAVLQDFVKNARGADSLLRGLAVHDFRLATIFDFGASLEYTQQDALADLTRSCVSRTWYQWHGVVNTCLSIGHLDPHGVETSVEILLYALSVAICLDMPMERKAFLSQLARLRAFEERRQGRWVTAPDNSHHREQWYVELEEACSGTVEQKLWALQNIHGWIQSLQSALQVDVESKVEMTQAVAELEDGDFLLHDPARSFIRADNLIKRSSRTGRSTEYRFYLFSDVLIYASGLPDGRYKIHEELPLHLMKVVDWFPPSYRNRQIMFEVHHPRKSFQVFCHSHEERKSWVGGIRAAIIMEMERKMKIEAARIAAYVR
jgi:hypothetical protein